MSTYIWFFIAIALTGCGLPLPEEGFVILAGVMAHTDDINPWLGFAVCLAGAMVGDMAMYAIGYTMGKGVRKHRWTSKLINAQTEARTEIMIRKHGLKVFLLARFLVGIRAPMYVSAGVLRVPFARFLAIDAVCATIVVGTVYGLSYIYGKHFEAAWQWIRQSQEAVTVAIVLLAVILVLLVLWRRRRRARVLPEEPLNDEPAEEPGEGDSRDSQPAETLV
ncbi:MAG: DedA family protein [Planctomycetia bacterium]|nr:DedA family protein [Planctomycetia bacterium]